MRKSSNKIKTLGIYHQYLYLYAKINEKCKKDLALGSLADITMVAKNSVLGALRAYENIVMIFTVNVFCGIQSDYKKYVWMEKMSFSYFI